MTIILIKLSKHAKVFKAKVKGSKGNKKKTLHFRGGWKHNAV